jgi:hypothetical protein
MEAELVVVCAVACVCTIWYSCRHVCSLLDLRSCGWEPVSSACAGGPAAHCCPAWGSVPPHQQYSMYCLLDLLCKHRSWFCWWYYCLCCASMAVFSFWRSQELATLGCPGQVLYLCCIHDLVASPPNAARGIIHIRGSSVAAHPPACLVFCLVSSSSPTRASKMHFRQLLGQAASGRDWCSSCTSPDLSTIPTRRVFSGTPWLESPETA